MTNTPSLTASDLVTVPRKFLDFLRHAPVGSGTCCCGDDMAKHSDPMSCGHSPIDQWHHSLSQWLEQIEALAPAHATGGHVTVPQDILESGSARPWRVEGSIYSGMEAEIVGERGIAQIWKGPNALADAMLIVTAVNALAASPALLAPQSGAAMREALQLALPVLRQARGERLLAEMAAAAIHAALDALSSPAPEGEPDLTDDELFQLGCELHEAYVNGELLAPEGEAGMADVSIGALLRNNSVPGAPEGEAAQGVEDAWLDFEPDLLDDPKAGKEPSIRSIAYAYYRAHMNAERAQHYTDRYVAALRAPPSVKQEEPGRG